MSGVILVVSGPSGSGKSSVLSHIVKRYQNTYFSVSHTSRAPRNGEQDGKDYHFVSKEEFQKGIENDEFLEWALVHENYYGTSIKPIQKAYEEGKIVILDIDVQGHDIVRDKMGNLVTSIFLTTPDSDILTQRLINRNTDNKESIAKRIKNASVEMQSVDKYDYLLINEELQTTIEEFDTILKASQLKTVNTDTKNFIKHWNKKEK